MDSITYISEKVGDKNINELTDMPINEIKKYLDNLELSKKGLNLIAPKTEQEIKAYKAIQNAHNNIIQKVNAWDQNKKQIDAIEVLEKADKSKPLTFCWHISVYPKQHFSPPNRQPSSLRKSTVQK